MAINILAVHCDPILLFKQAAANRPKQAAFIAADTARLLVKLDFSDDLTTQHPTSEKHDGFFQRTESKHDGAVIG